jgi:hypothetical protein
MSRTVTPQQSHPSNTGSMTTMKIPQDKIAQRAYEKWCKRGCQHGSDKQDWLEAEAELRAEVSRTAGMTQPRR